MKKKTMIRKQLYILSEQADRLHAQAKEYGISEGQLVRNALEQVLPNSVFNQEVDIEAWNRELQFIQSCRVSKQSKVNTEHHVWKRSDLYER